MEFRLWDKSQRLTIGSMAKLFGMNASTLRFWESEGLLKTERNPDNNYRDYDYQSLLDISDLVLMKNMGMTLEDMRRYPCIGLSGLGTLYANRSNALAAQIAKLEEILCKVNDTRELMREFNALYRSKEIVISEPDVLQMIPHKRIDDPTVWRKYFSGQYQFGTVFLPDGKDGYSEIWGWVPAVPEPGENSIWEFKSGERVFAQCAMWVNVRNRKRNNVDELHAFFRASGYATGMIVARYVCTAYELGSRNDFYKAWIELI